MKYFFFSLLVGLSMGSFAQKAESEARSLEAPTGGDAAQDDVVFTRVEQEAEFPGGTVAWRQFLMKHLNARLPAKNGAPAGTYKVIVEFIVSKTGVISDIKAITKQGYGMEQEVIRVIKTGPNWKPAWQNGRYVNAYRKQPVVFLIEN